MSATQHEAKSTGCAEFRDVMASFPAGVTVNTTVDSDGQWWGFTASAFCSLSADPPLVLVCLAKSAECYPAFMSSDSIAIHFVQKQFEGLARTFATRGADKFTGHPFELTPRGLPVLRELGSVLECSVFARYDGGDHTIIVGRVEDALLGSSDPVVFYKRDFHSLPLPPEGDVPVSGSSS